MWSFWTKPFRCHYNETWLSAKHHLLAWVLSVETARRHYPQTLLVTDNEGAEMLVNGIGLEFDQVSTALNGFDTSDADWWVLGKLYAYRAQEEPFVHIDNDVFLWSGLPEELMTAPLCAQNPEYFSFELPSYYRPLVYDQALRNGNGWSPDEWTWYVSKRGGRAINCGFFGGTRLDFINYYADLAIRFLENPLNRSVWACVESKRRDNVIFEQYLLSACMVFHEHWANSPFKDISIRFLFHSLEDAFLPERAREAGYTHMIAGAKRNKKFTKRLEQRVARDYPTHYKRCNLYINKYS